MPKGMNARFREMFKPRNECTPERNAAVNTIRKTQTTNQGLHYTAQCSVQILRIIQLLQFMSQLGNQTVYREDDVNE